MNRLITPTVHLNGSSKEELVQLRLAAVDACRVLYEAMQKASPNDRDYYPQGEGVGKQAREAWAERMLMIEQLSDELLTDAMKITLG